MRECRIRGLRVPSRGTVLRRIAKLDPVKTVVAREGRDAARALQSAGGTSPEITGLMEQAQIDHTPVDVIVVDERHRLPVGRPYVTIAIDVASRCVPGLVVTLEAPSATSVGLCLAHTVTDKRAWLEQLGVEAAWPMSGKPRELFCDNAAEFKSEALRRGCAQHGIALRYRPPGQPHFGGVVERVIGTMMQMVHELPSLPEEETGRRARGLLNLHLQEMRLASSPSSPVTAERIAAIKASAIRDTSGGTLELMPSRASFPADVAGLPAVRLALEDAQRAGRTTLQILLSGPPGTGKTLAATAIAEALNVPAVRYGEILNEYVGVAERNMARANQVLRAMAPRPPP